MDAIETFVFSFSLCISYSNLEVRIKFPAVIMIYYCV